MPTAPTIATPPPAEAAPAPSREGQDGVALWLAWVASVAAAMAAGVGVWLYRAPLAEFWPPLQRLL
jgi:TctA family transporter